MATKFFIGGNVFYDDELEAETALATFMEKHGIPEDTFVIVKIHKTAPAEAPASVH